MRAFVRPLQFTPAVFLLVTSCAGSPAPRTSEPESASDEEPRDPAAGEGDRFVVLDSRAPLYASPDDAEPAIGSARAPAAGRTPGRTRAFRLIGRAEGWLEIETLSIGWFGGPHCKSSGIWALRGARVRFFARADHLFPVLTRAFRAEFSDGTSVELKPGVPVGPSDRERAGLRRIYESGFELFLEIDESYLGDSYAPETAFSTEAPEKPERWLSFEAFSSQALQFDSGRPVGPKPRVRADAAVRGLKRIYAAEDRGERALVELRGTCIRLRALVADEHIRDRAAGVIGALSAQGNQGPPRARAGSTIYWRDGRRAGEVVEPLGFYDEVEPAGERRCFRLVTSSRLIESQGIKRKTEPTEFLELCFDEGAIVEAPKDGTDEDG